jgi:single-strand DNA-binding protein
MVTGRLRWDTPEGDKRSVTEIEADEVGASLKWATAKVERTSQRGAAAEGMQAFPFGLTCAVWCWQVQPRATG